MAKSKNHTAHNQSHKAHKNGIKKPRKHRHTSTKGVCDFLLQSLLLLLNPLCFFLICFNSRGFVYRWTRSSLGTRGTRRNTIPRVGKMLLGKSKVAAAKFRVFIIQIFCYCSYFCSVVLIFDSIWRLLRLRHVLRKYIIWFAILKVLLLITSSYLMNLFNDGFNCNFIFHHWIFKFSDQIHELERLEIWHNVFNGVNFATKHVIMGCGLWFIGQQASYKSSKLV